MRVLILHNEVAADAGPHECDVLHQADAVEQALLHRGHSVSRAACALDLEQLRALLASQPPDVVFNLVESLGGRDRLIAVVPSLLEALGVPFTGSGSKALATTTDKLWAKELLAAAGIATPPTLAVHDPLRPASARRPTARSEQTAIAKSRFEHGSLGLGDDAILPPGTDLDIALRERARRLGGACFAEQYLDGREINVALLERAGRVQVLPPSEILFEGFGQRPRIVGYRAKWEAVSFEYQATPRRLVFPSEDAALLEQLRELSLRVWELLGLSGWARVDFRIVQDTPYVLEANANPCLAPDAGFAAALDRAGISFAEAIEALLRSALAGGGSAVSASRLATIEA